MYKYLFWITLLTWCSANILKPSQEFIDSHAGDTFTLTCSSDSEIKWEYPALEYSPGTPKISISEKRLADTLESQLTVTDASYLDTGFYRCHQANYINGPQSRETYVFVQDDEHLMVHDNSSYYSVTQYRNLTVPCRPTSRNVSMSLIKDGMEVKNLDYDMRTGFLMRKIKVIDSISSYSCVARQPGSSRPSETHHFLIHVFPHSDSVNKPEIRATKAAHVIVGQPAELECTLRGDRGVLYNLDWVLPNPWRFHNGDITITNSSTLDGGDILEHKKLTIKKALLEDSGRYICNVSDSSDNYNQEHYDLKVHVEDKPYLNLTSAGKDRVYVARPGQNTFEWVVSIVSYPEVKKITWLFRQGNNPLSEIRPDNEKYTTTISPKSRKLIINHPNVNDSGTYVLNVSNRVTFEVIDMELNVEAPPAVEILKLYNETTRKYEDGKPYFMKGKSHKLSCRVIAYPEPNISWYFHYFTKYPEVEDYEPYPIDEEEYDNVVDPSFALRKESRLHIQATQSGRLYCKACNDLACHSESINFLVTDVAHGFNLWGNKNLVVGDNASLSCAASVYNFSNNFTWAHLDKTGRIKKISKSDNIDIVNESTDLSYHSILKLKNVTLMSSGTYKCEVESAFDNTMQQLEITVNVKASKFPTFLNDTTLRNATTVFNLGEKKNLLCNVTGAPTPRIYWFHNSREIVEPEKPSRKDKNRIQLRDNNMTLHIHNLVEEDHGTYICRAVNRLGSITTTQELSMAQAGDKFLSYFALTLFGLIVILFTAVVIFLVCKVKRERKLRKELVIVRNALEAFDEGAAGSINPELSIFEQADLLPYNLKYEFPRDKLKLGKQLGSGAFGVVLKAEADGIIEKDVVTTVAVKMLKQNVDNSHLIALTTELKVMIHLGQHLNVVNLLGACTRSLNDRELLVIVEYCKYGNLHNYLQKHRDKFVNQINPLTGAFDPTIIPSVTSLKGGYVNIPNVLYQKSQSSNSGGVVIGGGGGTTAVIGGAGDDVTGTTLATPIGEDGYLVCRDVAAERNYSRDEQPLCTQDLLCWSFQIARGMEYLANRKVLHGDLAARNILLAENNIVKICDFGLSKNMYAYDNTNYYKKGKRLLPVKWMAVEAIRDRNFSIQSDVWAYGVLLWELFSLACVPYPLMDDIQTLLLKLEQGYRMEQPQFATAALYEVMQACWRAKPAQRPTFTDLANTLGAMLEESVMKHYVDLNDPYLSQNEEFLSQQDYLSMLRSPEYVNCDDSASASLGYVPMRMRDKESVDAKEETELRPMLGGAGALSGSASDTESLPNSPSADDSSPPRNLVNVSNAMDIFSFSNPTYHNMDRPPLNPYTNTPYVIEKEGKPYGQQWTSSSVDV
ncbi:vascular endothelial growth factor receptor 1 isoform X2 [Nilaparvata lugens]|uniref:vascular endothelial growth factor receptor 1 isoform X2 n=1 Tax=Nilaparvata lugens TaxID=108931 RepID=UPI00193D5121|nr:vascular endothelial growth factor receptor 1 isoform X2 [Nilaparvata lugens]